MHVILQALHKTLEFEKELDERFSGEGTSASALAEFTNSDGAPVPADEATTIKCAPILPISQSAYLEPEWLKNCLQGEVSCVSEAAER